MRPGLVLAALSIALLTCPAQARAQAKAYVWTVNAPHVRIDCTLAAVTFVNRGSVNDASGTTPVTWLETALLTWDRGAWRVSFLESFRAKPTG